MKSTPETVQIWAVGQKLWLRDYPGIYEALKKEWSENISQIMEAVKGICKPLLCCLIYILLHMQTQVHISLHVFLTLYTYGTVPVVKGVKS